MIGTSLIAGIACGARSVIVCVLSSPISAFSFAAELAELHGLTGIVARAELGRDAARGELAAWQACRRRSLSPSTVMCSAPTVGVDAIGDRAARRRRR